MARFMFEWSEIYRVVVRVNGARHPDGSLSSHTNFMGPYTTAGAARRILSRERARHEDREETWPDHGWGTFEGWIERASISWEKVV